MACTGKDYWVAGSLKEPGEMEPQSGERQEWLSQILQGSARSGIRPEPPHHAVATVSADAALLLLAAGFL
jgi:hypothetical protein